MKLTAALLLIVFGWSVCPAQAASEKLEFEVASVRQNMTNDEPTSSFSLDNGFVFATVGKDETFEPPGGLFSATNTSLLTYITFAYNLTPTQFLALRAWQLHFDGFAGAAAPLPKWAYDDRFDIRARADGHPTKDQMRLMLQALLEERFHLVVHKEKRELPIFALVLVKPGSTGPRLKPHSADDTCASDSSARGYPPICGLLAHIMPSSPGLSTFGGRAVTMDAVAGSLPTQTGLATLSKPVIDETGLSGLFDVAMEWVQMAAPGATTEVAGPTFEQALKEQLGLRLESKKGPVEMLVIDKVERPSAN